MPPERETLDIDVLFVGAGPASLAGAYRLSQLVAEHSAEGHGDPLEVSIAVIEKGAEMGSHALSGAVIDPRALRELFPADWREAPLEGEIKEEKLLWLTSKRAISLPVPPMLDNEGKYVASLGKLVKWMAAKVEAAGVDIFAGFPGRSVLLDGERVVGVRTGDRGVDKTGKPKSNYEPGIDIRTKVVVLGEGPRGTLTLELERSFDLMRGKNPQVYAIGLKEVWEIPGALAPGDVAHTMGWPLDLDTFGGGFVYGMKDDLVIVGLVVGLDYRNPYLDPHQEFQRFKTHPFISSMLKNAKMAHYGAKAIPEGGYYTMPRSYFDGGLVIGDGASLLNSQRLKGIHLAMKSGMLAAETLLGALLKDDFSERSLSTYEDKLLASWAGKELYGVRNFHQGFEHGLLPGVLNAGFQMVTGGRGWKDPLPNRAGHERMRKVHDVHGSSAPPPSPMEVDGKLTFNKVTNVYFSGAKHEENQPSHLLIADLNICHTRCTEEFSNPCQRFCPANVYEMVDRGDGQGKQLMLNPSNCVHCKTCDIMDPYQIITWVPPESGGGPNYVNL
jgi:electron-transferring-flavoprotein dehydrogenase